jgi:hypothetical protein
MAEETSFLMGACAIGVSFFFAMMGWISPWILFGVLIFAAVLYETKFFATGAITGFSSGVFTAIGWLTPWIYFSAVVLGVVFLAVKVAGQYVNTGQNK